MKKTIRRPRRYKLIFTKRKAKMLGVNTHLCRNSPDGRLQDAADIIVDRHNSKVIKDKNGRRNRQPTKAEMR